MHQFGWLSERGGKLFKFASERGGFPQNEFIKAILKEYEYCKKVMKKQKFDH